MSTYLVLLSALALAGSPPAVSAPAPTPAWSRTLERVTPAVVAIHVTATRDFDTESAGSSQGTGFVVDAERGILLTNRHMVHTGPIVAEGVFLDHEEVPLVPIYRDPVHDFGFYRFDPKALEHMDVVALELAPDAAAVGTEVRVVGNDAGEKLSILDGTLARLDREAPYYGDNTYNDFNTFYIQAASGTSGGSSGSPVLDVNGRVLALNAGGSRDAASSFYLPLYRVARALEYIRRGEPVPRGTLEATFEVVPYAELKLLGLDPATEDDWRQRFPTAIGLLVVKSLVPEGPAWGQLEPGDALLSLNDAPVPDFVTLESILDDHVGEPLSAEVVRGGHRLTLTLSVQDLHSVSPDDYLEVGRAVLHDVSYHQARNHMIPQRGAYLAVSGYMFGRAGLPDDIVIIAVDGEAVPNTDALQRILQTKAHGARLEVRYFAVDEPRRERVAVVEMDRLWHSMDRCNRDDTLGIWPCVDAPPPPAPAAPVPSEPLFAESGSKAARALSHSLVMVDFDIPHPTAGVKDFNYLGAGLVVDAERGLVLVDRDTVPVTLGDLTLTFGGTARISAQVRYLHPIHNFAILQYDPSLLAGADVRSARLVDAEQDVGAPVWQIGLNGRGQMVDARTSVAEYDTVSFSPSDTPRFRDANAQVYELESVAPSLGGAVTNKRGDVVALWASFMDQGSGDASFWGLPTAYVLPAVHSLQQDQEPTWSWLGAELLPTPLAEAHDLGLSDVRAKQLFDADPRYRQALMVVRLTAGTEAASRLQVGDLVVAVNGVPVTQAGEVERELDPFHASQATLTVVRDRAEQEIALALEPLDGRGVERVVRWAGLLLHDPHVEIAAQQGFVPTGVYVAWLWYGTPGARYGLRPTRRITQIEDTPIQDLDALLALLPSLKGKEGVRVRLESLDGRTEWKVMKLDETSWPTLLLERVDGEWRRTELE